MEEKKIIRGIVVMAITTLVIICTYLSFSNFFKNNALSGEVEALSGAAVGILVIAVIGGLTLTKSCHQSYESMTYYFVFEGLGLGLLIGMIPVFGLIFLGSALEKINPITGQYELPKVLAVIQGTWFGIWLGVAAAIGAIIGATKPYTGISYFLIILIIMLFIGFYFLFVDNLLVGLIIIGCTILCSFLVIMFDHLRKKNGKESWFI